MANEEAVCATVQHWVRNAMHIRLQVNDGTPPAKVVEGVASNAGPCGLTLIEDSSSEKVWISWGAIIDVRQI